MECQARGGGLKKPSSSTFLEPSQGAMHFASPLSKVERDGVFGGVAAALWCRTLAVGTKVTVDRIEEENGWLVAKNVFITAGAPTTRLRAGPPHAVEWFVTSHALHIFVWRCDAVQHFLPRGLAPGMSPREDLRGRMAIFFWMRKICTRAKRHATPVRG